MELQDVLEEVVALPSAGVVRVDEADGVVLERAWGLADRAHQVPMTPRHRVAIASGSKAVTAVAVLSLVAEGVLGLDAPVRPLLGADLPEIDDRVTVRHLLAHRSGIGEYLDDDADLAQYLLAGPMSGYTGPESFLPVLAGHPRHFEPDERFEYSNAGYLVLALLAERASGTPFTDLVQQRVLDPAGMVDSGFFRSDEPRADVATAYVEVDGRWRTTVHHLPVVAGGDGGMHTTAVDVRRLLTALEQGRLLPAALVEQAWTPHSVSDEDDGERYGLGFCLPAPGWVELDGLDAGASFWVRHGGGCTTSVLSTTSDGAWPVARFLRRQWPAARHWVA